MAVDEFLEIDSFGSGVSNTGGGTAGGGRGEYTYAVQRTGEKDTTTFNRNTGPA